MSKVRVKGDVDKMYCAKLKETLKARDTFILQHGEGALIESERVSREAYEKQNL